MGQGLERRPPWPALSALVLSLTACPSAAPDAEPEGSADRSGGGSDPDESPEASPPRDCGPGRVVLRRLNRLEYDHTVRDLLGHEGQPSETFPADDSAYGFDTVAEALSLSPLLFERFEATAERLAFEAVAAAEVEPRLRTFEAEELAGTNGRASDGAWRLLAGGAVSVEVAIERAGTYEVSARAAPWRSENAPPTLELRVGGAPVASVRLIGEPGVSESHRASVSLQPGTRRIEARFVDDRDPAASELREIGVDFLGLEGPFDAAPRRPDGYARLVPCDPAVDGRRACLVEVLGAFARRAWRRPVTEVEVAELVALADLAHAEGDGFEVQIALGLQAILLSPHFVFRVELGEERGADGVVHLTDHELATRLSYFLWRTTPDDELLDLADDGRLSDPVVLEAQVDRMLADERAKDLVRDFGGQWIHTRALADAQPNLERYPEWDGALRDAMEAESHRFLEAFMLGTENALDLLDADFTFVNDRLARHYGLSPPGSEELRRVALSPAVTRGGLLFQGAFLTVTSHPRRTSPVKRGALVLDALLCSTPPPPPPGVEGLSEPVEPQASLRDRFEAHRSRPECSACHDHIDPIGFALEPFDGIGAWRSTDDGFPIDASGELADGTAFAGPTELAALLKRDPRFPACLTEKLATFALGRSLGRRDACELERLEASFAAHGYDVRALIRELVKSELFVSSEREVGP